MPELVWPVRGAVRSSLNEADKPGEGAGEFGTRRSRGTHSGIDIQAPDGTAVLAAAAGTVVPIAPNPSTTYGTQLVIEHQFQRGNATVFTAYAHLQPGSVSIFNGDAVSAGQRIAGVGRSGNTPRRGDSHLHFEVRLGSKLPRTAGGRVIDPLLMLP